ncbi:hypothetical protein B0H21DRAFT_730460 [Amylocystis lapponica]|nr:hypothetical protein B0H21DRAFT_730460 [Amylocystis lapponica]
MATRQNKKRKGRGNAMNRERTVTTLTEGPESTFLVPTPTEDPPSNILSSPFSVSSSAPGAGPNMSPSAFQMGPNPYAFSFNNYIPPMPGPSFPPPHQPQQFFHAPQVPPAPIPGHNDLEVLENLKESIKNGQHEFFRAVPQPAALASLYLGPKSSLSQVPPHPEQVPDDQVPGLSHRTLDTAQPHSDPASINNGNSNGPPGLQNEPGRRLRTQSLSEAWDRRPHAQPPVSDSQTPNNSVRSPVPGLRYNSPQRYDSSSGPAPASQLGSDLRGRPSADFKPSLPGGHSGSTDGVLRSSNHDVNSDSSRVGASGHTKYESQALGRTSSDKSLASDSAGGSRATSVPPTPKSAAHDAKDELRTGRESNWSYRNAPDDKPFRHDVERSGTNGSFIGRAPGETRFSSTIDNNARGPRDSRIYDREKDRDREYGRDRDKDRDWERDRDRDRRPDYTRPRDDRRNDERTKFPDTRRPPPEQRHYETRHGEVPRRYDPKPAGEISTSTSRFGHPEDRVPLSEERAIHRPPPPDDRRPAASDTARPPVDDRRGPPPSRSYDDRRPPVPPADRSVRPPDDRRPAPPSTLGDRPARPADDRRPLSPPSDRMRVVDDRRPHVSPPPVDRQARLGDDRRHTGAPSSAAADRQVRPADDRRPPIPPSGLRAPLDERRPPPPSASLDRHVRPLVDDRRPPPPPLAEDRGARPLAGPPADTTASRPSTEESKTHLQAHPEDRSVRPVVPLEDRISRPPALSLQERISAGASSNRPDERSGLGPASSARVDDRLSRPAPSLEERLSHAQTASDDRAPRPPRSDEPLARPPQSAIPSASAASRPVPGDDRNTLLAEPVRHLPSAQTDRPRPADDRGRPVSDRFARAASPAVSERGPPAARPPPYHSAPRASSVVRDDSRPYKPRSPVRSPARTERDFRPPYRPDSDRYASERRPDHMDVDPPPSRFGDGRPPYRRPSAPPDDGYVPIANRPWLPSSDPYPGEPARRVPPEPPAYGRDWRDDERGYPNDWDAHNGRPWERPAREYSREREGRYGDRDPVTGNGWETREERERRVSLGATAEAPASAPRTFEPRPLSSRLTNGYPEERYGRDLERARYPPVDSTPLPFSRVRPRSPSPLRRPGAVDDLRPPLKRAREDFPPASGYYSPVPRADSPRAGPPPAEYPPRLRTPPVGGGGYYDDPRAPGAPPPPYSSGQAGGPPRERDYDARDRPSDLGGYPPYDRREAAGRMPPPRSPPPYRGGYGRDDRRYGGPPRP